MGFEVVVRPVVFPNIRPAPAQLARAASDPTQGLATINGGSGQFLDLQYSQSISSQQSSRLQESRRKFDVQRVYQMEDDGSVNKENWVDIETIKQMRMLDGTLATVHWKWSQPPEGPNIETIENDHVRTSKSVQRPL